MAPGTFFSSWSFMSGSSGGRRAPQTCDARLGYYFAKCDSGRLAQSRDVLREAELAQTGERRVHDGDVIRGTHRLREDVLHAGRLEDGTHAATGDEAGAGRGGLEHHAAAIVFAEHIVRDRVALELNGDEVLVRIGRALLDRIGHFVGLAVADTDLALAVADNGERGEGKATTALHDLGAAIDEDDLLDHRRAVALLLLIAVVAARAAVAAGATHAALAAEAALTAG